MLLLIVLIFIIVFYIYQLPIEAVLYPAFLSFFLLLIRKIVRKNKEKNKVEIIERLDLNNLETNMPEADNKIEKHYQAKLLGLSKKVKEKENLLNEKYNERFDYYSTWVHQIKTPIASMCLMLAGDIDKEDLDMELSRIENYVDMAMNYIRLDSESTDFVIEEVDIDELLKNEIKTFSKDFIRKGLTLNYTETGLKVITDKKWMSFVIGQIISNSLKYTEEGSISIYNEGEALVIKDTGIGINSQDLPRIFEESYTGKTGRSFSQSTGIGLFLSKKILDELGHKIKIESESGKGTTVRLDLSRD